MPTAQRSKSTAESKSRSQPTAARAAQRGGAARKAATPEADASYNLISVLYHALQAAETYEQYIEDAEDAEDDELVQLLENVRSSQNQIAEQARQLLATRLAGQGGSASSLMSDEDEDLEDEDEDEDDDE